MITKRPLRESGLVGTLFLPPSSHELPLVITLGGGGGGLKEERAEMIASHGFAALALAYFNAEGLPPFIEEIPLEYFEKAFRWVKGQAKINRDKIGLWGVSRGAELSLLLGTVFPNEVQAIAAHVPSSVVYGTFRDKTTPAWIYRGKPILPSAPFPDPTYDECMGLSCETAIPLTPSFLQGMKDEKAFQAAAIPVEKIKCPLLFFSGEDDQMWPSSLYCQQIIDRLIQHKSTVPYTHIKYPKAGHFIAPFNPVLQAEVLPLAKLWFALGGNPEADAFAKSDSWEKTLQFFNQYLNGD